MLTPDSWLLTPDTKITNCDEEQYSCGGVIRRHTRRSFLQTSLAATSAVLADALGAVPAEVKDVAFLQPEDAGYAETRALYNSGIATQPKRLARCANEAGVRSAVRRAIAENWPLAVKAGGHSFEGLSLNDDGLVVEVSAMKELRLDAKTGVLTAGAGCRLAEVNRFLMARGRLDPRDQAPAWSRPCLGSSASPRRHLSGALKRDPRRRSRVSKKAAWPSRSLVTRR